MRLTTAIGAATSLFLAPQAVLGHGWVHRYITATDTYVAPDAYNGAVNKSLPIRWYEGSGPAAPFTGSNITCGPGGNVPTNVVAPVAAGSYVIFDWDSWQSSHSGPVMTYVAYCGTSGCANFKGDSGNVWIKIQQDAYNPDRTAAPWGENLLHTNPQFKVTIPASLAPGEYIIRHEILALHVAGTLNGAQFYPNCLQIKVTGSGTQRPTGIALPGAYDPNDPGILVELWRISPTSPAYTAPGGGVQLGGSWLPSPTTGVTSATSTTAKPTSTSTSTAKPTSVTTTNKTTSTTKTSATPTPTSGGAALYGQCGGQGWTGPTTCAQGTCTYSNAYYSQCLP